MQKDELRGQKSVVGSRTMLKAVFLGFEFRLSFGFRFSDFEAGKSSFGFPALCGLTALMASQ